RLPEGFAGVFEPEGGYLLCERAIVEMAAEAARYGARIRENEPVRSWSVDAGGVIAVTDRAAYRAAKLVIAAGAWSAKVAGDLGVSLEVTRQILGWLRPADAAPFRDGHLPCWAIDHGEGLLYGFPISGGEPLLKVANHHRGAATDPDRLDRRATPDDAEDFLAHLRRYLPSAIGPVERMKVCMYTNSSDGHFYLDRHPRHSSVAVACGFSGHGFKFATVVGEALADLALAGRTDLPIGFLSLARRQPASRIGT
ncbi:MAG: FAD-dependent oxidoreductase, partial [Candidatus Binatia bacterium]